MDEYKQPVYMDSVWLKKMDEPPERTYTRPLMLMWKGLSSRAQNILALW